MEGPRRNWKELSLWARSDSVSSVRTYPSILSYFTSSPPGRLGGMVPTPVERVRLQEVGRVTSF